MKTTLFVVLLAVLMLSACIAAFAADQTTGTLTGKGDGSPRCYMTLGSVRISGDGPLLVSSNAKVTFTEAQPSSVKPHPGKLAGKNVIQYDRFVGEAVVNGEHITVGMYGKGISLSASGAGYSLLFGTGTYALTNDADPNHPTNGNWTPYSSIHGSQKPMEIIIGQPSPSDDPVK